MLFCLPGGLFGGHAVHDCNANEERPTADEVVPIVNRRTKSQPPAASGNSPASSAANEAIQRSSSITRRRRRATTLEADGALMLVAAAAASSSYLLRQEAKKRSPCLRRITYAPRCPLLLLLFVSLSKPPVLKPVCVCSLELIYLAV